MHRFYYGGSLSDSQVELTGNEAHHLTRVLRLTANDRVEVFDGRGQAAVAEVRTLRKNAVVLDVVSVLPESPPRRPLLTLFTASPKSDRLRWLVEKATELEVDQLGFLETQHSVVHPGAGKLTKMQATVVAACKQCGRNDLMRIDPPARWESVLRRAVASMDKVLIATPDGPPIGDHGSSSDVPGSIAVAVGPEGGWSDEELATGIECGALPVQFGSTTLRIETACLAAASVLRARYATPV